MSARVRFFSFLFFILLVIGAGGYGWFYVTKPSAFPIRSVQVVGKLHFVNPAELQKRIMPYVSKGFFNVPVARISQNLQHIPGVKSVLISRVFPATVQVHINEKTPLAFYHGGGLVSSNGLYFNPQYQNDLPAMPVFDVAKADLPRTVALYNNLSKVLASDDLVIAKLALSNIGQWQVTLSNNAVLYPGSIKVIERIEAFAKSYPTLLERNKGKTLVSVDLRYRQGFAVRWASS